MLSLESLYVKYEFSLEQISYPITACTLVWDSCRLRDSEKSFSLLSWSRWASATASFPTACSPTACTHGVIDGEETNPVGHRSWPLFQYTTSNLKSEREHFVANEHLLTHLQNALTWSTSLLCFAKGILGFCHPELCFFLSCEFRKFRRNVRFRGKLLRSVESLSLFIVHNVIDNQICFATGK